YTALKAAPPGPASPDWAEPHGARFRGAMDDDFNTPEAVAALFDLAGEANRTRSAALARQLRALGGILGLLQQDATAFLQSASGAGADLAAAEIERLIGARNAARKARDYAEADRIRKRLAD